MMRRLIRAAAAVAILVSAGLTASHAQRNEAALTVVLVRHAERAAEPADDPVLSPAGTERVQALARLLSGSDVSAAYATQFARTRLTAGPVANSHGAELRIVEARRGADHIADVVDRIRSHQRGEVVLIAGHSNTIPPIVNQLTGLSLENLTEHQYDRLYIVTLPDPNGVGSLITLRYGAASPD